MELLNVRPTSSVLPASFEQTRRSSEQFSSGPAIALNPHRVRFRTKSPGKCFSASPSSVAMASAASASAQACGTSTLTFVRTASAK